MHHSLDPAMLLFALRGLNPEHRRVLNSTVHTHLEARYPFGNSTFPQFSCYQIWVTATFVIRVSSMWMVNEAPRTMFSATPRSSEMDAATTLIRTPRYASSSSRAEPAFGASNVRRPGRQKAIHVPEDPIQADHYARRVLTEHACAPIHARNYSEQASIRVATDETLSTGPRGKYVSRLQSPFRGKPPSHVPFILS